MKPVTMRVLGAAVAALAMTSGAMAQSYYDDVACRQYADQATAPMRSQAGANQVGSTLLGAGLGAALGAAAGGGRGAGIGAASGAIVGTGVGAANAQYDAGYVQQQYNAYYYQCMQGRTAPSQAYAPAPGYAPAPYPTGAYQQPYYQQPYYSAPGYR